MTKKFAIDTNILVYAHNKRSPFHEKAKTFVNFMLAEQNDIKICIPVQVFTEFLRIVTWQKLESPLSLPIAISLIQDYIDAGVCLLGQRETQLQHFLDLMQQVNTRNKIFDVALAVTLKDNDIQGIYTANVDDFIEFEFLEVINPLI
jgi:predicted nucleic acid-binding protein